MDVSIRRFETHYRLAGAALAEHTRLDQIKTRAIDEAFRTAVAQTGIGEDAELCIRSLFVPVRLRLNTSDVSIAANWSAALAEEIVRVIHNGPTTNLVVYHSRRQALQDLAIGVARGNRQRAWAWRRLGLWQCGYTAGDHEAVSELVRALQQMPALIVPTLRALADTGLLPSVSRRFTSLHWQALAQAVLVESRTEHLLEIADKFPTVSPIRAALEVLRKSRLLRAVVGGEIDHQDTGLRWALAVLAITDVEPGALQRANAPALIYTLANSICGTVVEIEARLRRLKQIEVNPRGKQTPVAAAGEDSDAGQEIEDALTQSGRAAAPDEEDLSQSPEPTSESLAATAAEHSVAREGFEPGKEFAESNAPVDFRRRVFSRFAGLLLLTAIIAELELPEQILASEVLASRPLAWVMHKLALALAPLAAEDPAALALAGLSPETKSPFADEPRINPDEAETLNAFADQIVARVSSLIQLDEGAEVSPLEFVTRRRGEIVADPGWIEVRFSLDDLTTEIRRVGLDLNPGYVPWLGVVLMFVYE